MFDFSDRVVMVTGAAGNLGQAVSKAFEQAGAKLVLVDHASDRLARMYPELAGSSDHHLAASVDLTDASAVTQMVTQTLQHFARVDVLANIAGGFRSGTPVHETSPDTWDFMLDLNARTILNTVRAVVPGMLERHSGKIISIGSRAALEGSARMAAYSVAKSAVLRITESMAAELKRKGINVNAVLPGTIDTPGNREAMPKADHTRWVQPAAIADVILFLASDAARAIHGAAIPVYGLS
jgi:NAD(P)-dependent dehydrogenase (short-subunit alcohol dehydrogenase family)